MRGTTFNLSRIILAPSIIPPSTGALQRGVRGVRHPLASEAVGKFLKCTTMAELASDAPVYQLLQLLVICFGQKNNLTLEIEPCDFLKILAI